MSRGYDFALGSSVSTGRLRAARVALFARAAPRGHDRRRDKVLALARSFCPLAVSTRWNYHTSGVRRMEDEVHGLWTEGNEFHSSVKLNSAERRKNAI